MEWQLCSKLSDICCAYNCEFITPILLFYTFWGGKRTFESFESVESIYLDCILETVLMLIVRYIVTLSESV
jgi:hypothetical protein